MATNAAHTLGAPPISLRAFGQKLLDSWTWVSLRWMKVLVVVCALLSCVAIYVATTDKIVIGPFSVPREYEERGYNSEAISNAIVQFIHGNESTITLTQTVHPRDSADDRLSDAGVGVDEDAAVLENIDGKHVVSSFDQSTIADIKVPLTSFTLESLVEFLRTTIGHQPTRIAGEIVFLDNGSVQDSRTLDPQRSRVLIRYKIEYPEPSYSFLGYHWWSRRLTTLTDTITSRSAEDAIQKLALVTADGVQERTLLHEEPESRADRYLARGNSYVGLGDYDRAARMYEQANSLYEKARGHGDAHAYLALGVIAEREANYQEAKRLYRIAAKVPESGGEADAAWAELYLGNLLVKDRGHINEAVEKYLRILALPAMKNYLGNTPVVQAAANNNLGFLFLSKRDWRKAEAYFTRGRDLADHIRESARNCAYGDAEDSSCGSLLSEGERQKAKAESLLNINLANQHLALSYYGLGEVHQHDEHDYAKSRDDYWKAIHANAKHAPTHYRLGVIYSKEHRYSQAIDQFQAAIQSDSGFEPAYTGWKDLIDRWPGLRDKQKTDKQFSRTLASKYKAWADNLQQAGDPDDAADRFCTAAALDAAYKGLCTAPSR